MNKLILDSNFKFLDEIEDFPQLNILKSEIYQTLNLYRDKHYVQVMISIRKCLENFMGFIREKYYFQYEPGDSLHEQIKNLTNEYDYIPQKIISYLYDIKSFGNEAAHYSGIFYSSDDAAIQIYHLYKVLVYFIFDSENPEHLQQFKIHIYIKESEHQSINIISKNDLTIEEKTKHQLDSVKTSIESWLRKENTQINIPIYQRGYSWTVDNIEALLNDIETRKEDGLDHYFGSVAAKKIIKNGKEIIKIIDGQQRLTTSIILMCVVRDILIENSYKKEKMGLPILNGNLLEFFTNPGKSDDENDSFKLVVKEFDNKKIKTMEENKKNNVYFTNYLLIRTWLTKNYGLNINQILKFFDTYISRFQLSTISFDPVKFSNKREMEIFENLNSKGRSLSLFDLIKNYIFNMCSNEIFSEDETTVKISSKFRSCVEDYLTDKSTSDKTNFFDTLVNYNTGKEIQNDLLLHFKQIKDTINELFGESELVSLDEYDEYVKKIENYVKIYSSFSEEKQIINSIIINDKFGVSNIIKILTIKKKRQLLIPLTYLLFDFYKSNSSSNIQLSVPTSDKKYIRNIYLIFVKFIIKATVATTQGDSEIKRKIVENVYKLRKIIFDKNNDITSIAEIEKEVQILFDSENNPNWSLSNFKEALRVQISEEMSKSILLLIQSHMINKEWNGESITYHKPSLEHIMPKKPELWLKELKTLNKLKNDDEINAWLEQHKLYIGKIGNHIILDLNDNIKATNNIFAIKKNEYQKSMSKLIRNENKNIDILDKNEWSFNEIDLRTEALIDYLTKNIITK